MISRSRLALPVIVAAAAVFAVVLVRSGKSQPRSWLDTSLTFEQRAAELVSRMSLEEKISQMSHNAPAIERLGIPAYNWWNEAVHGVACAGNATVFPQAIGLAASWDQELMLRVAGAISGEGRAKYHEALRHDDHRSYNGLTFWSPNLNIIRDPRWGRCMESYSEDPYLTARMGVQFVRGMQGDDQKYLKTVATPKHFAVHSGPEPLRDRFNALTSDRDLYDTYLEAFRAAVVEAGAWSIMGAYSRLRGEPCCSSPLLLEEILRGEWGFDGYVVSDCGAIEYIYDRHKVVGTAAQAAALAVEHGCDLNCGEVYESDLLEAVREGLISEDKIDTAVHRLFIARFKLGMFDPDSLVPYARLPYALNDCPAHRELALEAARKSIVLLKNEGGLLPLDRARYRKVLVLGPQAFSLDCLQGSYNGTPSEYITVLDGIRSKLPVEATVTYRTGCEVAERFNNYETIPPYSLLQPEGGGNGLKVEYFDNCGLAGEPVRTESSQMIAYTVDWLQWPWIPELRDTAWSARWTGRLVAPLDGRYALKVRTDEKFSFYLDGKMVLGADRSGEAARKTLELDFTAGSTHDIRFEMFDAEGDVRLLLSWRLPVQDDTGPLLDESDLVILCLGLSPNLEGEEMPVDAPGFKGGDRVSIALPRPQEELIARAAASGKPVVLVLLGGSALAVNRADSLLPAIVEAWYPGEEGGRAVADVLFGDYNPAGRLPVTFYSSEEQLPPFEDYDMRGRTYRYFSGRPLYPFGHGLSYTSFAYSDLELDSSTAAPGDSVRLSVTVGNTGKLAGDEVVQLYLTHLEPSVPVPLRSLAGFQRISLAPGEKKTVSFTLAARQMSVISDSGERLVQPGRFRVFAGGGQPGVQAGGVQAPLSAEFVLSGETRQLPL